MSRFSTEVVYELGRAGWTVGRKRLAQAEAWAKEIADHVSPDGHRHTVFPAALEAWTEFGGLRIAVEGPGAAVARRPFSLDPRSGLHLPRTLADVGRSIGTHLCPLGEEDGGAGHLAVDPGGRVFAIDHTGEWFLGGSVDDALTTLILGRAPARVRDDGTWA
ncbi:SUKH-3 domain-containing protein [Yinghuangia seranimata]|uniref:SUKH-3 domain-containing protein n=1 Tax=Yinghuangia seranimata TaxID=408067 RepID=UPI00248B664E|nr:SUKH-3 domain-containing protein [Yinghuangia seranimata]MDI2126747.1 SUKH-3 domain-containing protein [Yinghuangia seranimata]